MTRHAIAVRPDRIRPRVVSTPVTGLARSQAGDLTVLNDVHTQRSGGSRIAHATASCRTVPHGAATIRSNGKSRFSRIVQIRQLAHDITAVEQLASMPFKRMMLPLRANTSSCAGHGPIRSDLAATGITLKFRAWESPSRASWRIRRTACCRRSHSSSARGWCCAQHSRSRCRRARARRCS